MKPIWCSKDVYCCGVSATVFVAAGAAGGAEIDPRQKSGGVI